MIVALWRERSDGVAPMFPPGSGPYGPPLEMARVWFDASIDVESLQLARDAILSHEVRHAVEILGAWFELSTILQIRAVLLAWPDAMREIVVNVEGEVSTRLRNAYGHRFFAHAFKGLGGKGPEAPPFWY